jgi:EAL domain-containing protein (putative c-di-GMP-specific phosphodiesterase class I)
MERIQPPFVFSGYEVITTGSIGIVFYPDDGKDVEALLRNVDTAMYNAKGQGRNNFQFYNRSMNLKLADLLVLKNGLVHALERKEFVAFFQPQYRIGDGELIGAEALIRWVHPDRGLVSPDLFISLAEETGLIVPIGQQMLRTACHQWRNWQASVLEMKVAVNLSAREFRQENLVSIVAGILKDTGLKPSLLEIEITESSAMQNVEFTKRLLDELKEMGIKIAIDDFGTGYYSLSYLTRFPIDTVKVDRSFIKEILNDRRTAAIVSGIIALAHRLEFSVIAEGVDKPEQLAWLEQEGCDKVQGFLFSPPIPASLFGERLLRTKMVGD